MPLTLRPGSCRIGKMAALVSTALLLAIAPAAADPVAKWNVNAVSTALAAGESPVTISRTLAIVQVAVHDALNAIDRRYTPYAFVELAESDASADAAVITAAHDALVGAIAVGPLAFTGFGSAAQQAAAVAAANAAYVMDLAAIPNGLSKTHGITVGGRAANAILTLRQQDHAIDFVRYEPGSGPGLWEPTPNPHPFDPAAPGEFLPATLPGWGFVTPFVLRTPFEFLPDGPPALTSSQYARDYNEVQDIGDKLSSVRTPEQTSIARFGTRGRQWAGIASLASPPTFAALMRGIGHGCLRS